jgi:hypothetical protein
MLVDQSRFLTYVAFKNGSGILGFEAATWMILLLMLRRVGKLG